MMNRRSFVLSATAYLSLGPLAFARAGEADDHKAIADIATEVINPLMSEHDIPGLALGISLRGAGYIFCYGLADREDAREVTSDTLFEIGSVSKIFTATLGAYAQVQGMLSLSDPASRHWAALAGTAFDQISLANLATFTAGGLPLQFPDTVSGNGGLEQFYQNWRPSYSPGTYRVYSNPSIGLFGHLTAVAMGLPFSQLMQMQLLPALGLDNTFIHVPDAAIARYAFGYTKDNSRVRVAPGPLDSEAYGIKSTVTDMLRFIEVTLDPGEVEPEIHQAILTTHLGRYRVGAMTQALGWELVEDSPGLDQLLAANAPEMAFQPQKAEALMPALEQPPNVLFNKTGSTNGFGAYVAAIPDKKAGIVLLANRNFPIPARVTAARALLDRLDS